MAHLGGAVVGLLLGNVLLGLRNLRSYKTWKKTIWCYSLLVFLVFFIGITFINIFYLEEHIAQSFRMFDTDGDGLINEDELRITINNHWEPIDDSEINEIITEADLDGDGEIDLKEFQIFFINFLQEENDS